jgi:hypothetical protein
MLPRRPVRVSGHAFEAADDLPRALLVEGDAHQLACRVHHLPVAIVLADGVAGLCGGGRFGGRGAAMVYLRCSLTLRARQGSARTSWPGLGVRRQSCTRSLVTCGNTIRQPGALSRGCRSDHRLWKTAPISAGTQCLHDSLGVSNGRSARSLVAHWRMVANLAHAHWHHPY